MEITKVEIRPMQDEGALQAYASVIFDDVFIVHSVKVIRGGEGQYLDIAHPIEDAFRRRLEEAVLNQYHKVVGSEADPEPID